MKKYLILFALFFVHPIWASGYLTPYGTGVKVNKITVHGGGGATLWVSGISNPDECGDTGLVHIKGDLPGQATMISTVLTAYSSGKKIGLWSNGCEVIPFWGGTTTRPLVHTLWITD